MQRVLVVVPNWFGETLFATPFLQAVRAAAPDAFLATLGWPQCRAVLANNPSLNLHMDYDERGGHRMPRGAWDLVRTLRGQRFDTAFVLRRSLTRTLLLATAGIPRRIGFANRKSGWLLTDRVPPVRERLHKAASYLRLLEPIRGPTEMAGRLTPYGFWLSEEERRRAGPSSEVASWLEGRPLVVLHPGANWPHKRWPPDRFATLGDCLARGSRIGVVITGGPGDVTLARTIAEQMREPSLVLAGRTSLRELAACLMQASLVVAGDTGVLHVASALRRPVVGLYGPTTPAITGPLGDPARTVVLHHPDCCPAIPCYRPDDPAHAGMHAVTVDEVYAAAVGLLQHVSETCGTGGGV